MAAKRERSNQWKRAHDGKKSPSGWEKVANGSLNAVQFSTKVTSVMKEGSR